MTAYVLLQVSAGKARSVAGWLKKLEGVEEAYGIYGEHDVIAKVEVPTGADLDSLVVEGIHGNPNVVATTTLIAMESSPGVERRRAARRRRGRRAAAAGPEAPKRKRRARRAPSPAAQGPSGPTPSP